MLSPKLRRKLLLKWAQVPGAPSAPGAPASPASPASPGSPTSPTAPTTPDSTTGATKNPSQPASAMMNVSVGWPNQTNQYIDPLVVKIDKVVIAGTKKKYNFDDLFQNYPSSIATNYSPPDPTGDVIRFASLIIQQLMNNKKPFTTKLGTPDMRNRVGALLQSPYLQKFQQINPAGPLGSSGAQLSQLRADLLAFYNSLPLT